MGHFGLTAARYAVENIPATATGGIEFVTALEGREPHLYFAGELVCAAMLRHLPGDNTSEKVRRFFDDHLLVAHGHACRTAHILAVEYFIPRFRRYSA